MLTNSNFGLFKNLSFAPYERGFFNIKVNFLTDKLSERILYNLNVVQKITSTDEIIGGTTISIKKPIRPSFTAFAGDDLEISSNETVVLLADDINEDATYYWYDEDGNLIYIGTDLSISTEINKIYKLEVIADIDDFKDYDEVEVRIKQPEITSISPNPTNQSASLLVEYNSQNSNSLYMVVAPITGNFYYNYILDISEAELNVDVSSFNIGLYVLSLVSEGLVVDQKTFIID